MKNTPPKNEWSVEPVNFSERESLVTELALLLQLAHRRLVELEDQRQQTSERFVR
jgi:hypothetical protein